MTRLTNDMRNSVVETASKIAMDDKHAAYNKARAVFVEELYKHEYGVIGARVKRLPIEWQTLSRYITITHPDFSTSWRSGKPDGTFEMAESKPVPKSHTSVLITREHPLWTQAVMLATLYNSMRKEEDHLKETLRKLMYSYTTVKRLLEAWPEGKQYLPASAAPTTALVAVNLVPEVNALLGIKPKKVTS